MEVATSDCLQPARLLLPADCQLENTQCKQHIIGEGDNGQSDIRNAMDESAAPRGPVNYVNSTSCQNNVTPGDVISFSWQTVPSRKRLAVGDTDSHRDSKKASRDPRLNRKLLLSNAKISVPTSTKNKFSVLSTAGSDEGTPDTLRQPSKQARPPPIHLHCELKYTELVSSLTSLVGVGNFRCASTREGVTIYPSEPAHYRQIVNSFRRSGVPFHTYQLSEDKAYRIVIRGLHHSVDTQDIAQDLIARGYKVRQVTNILSRDKVSLPLFFVDLDSGSSNSSIFKIDTMFHSKITVEEPRQSKQMVQCRRCQKFGHTKNFCALPAKCVKCGGQHDSVSCGKPATEPAVCSNCSGPHPASYRGCVIYQELLKRKSSGRGTQRVRPASTLVATLPVTKELNNSDSFPPLPKSFPVGLARPTANPHRNQSVSYSQAVSQPFASENSEALNLSLSTQFSSFITEIRSTLTPILTMLTKLIEMLLGQNGQK
jgi:hypothetical protein